VEVSSRSAWSVRNALGAKSGATEQGDEVDTVPVRMWWNVDVAIYFPRGAADGRRTPAERILSTAHQRQRTVDVEFRPWLMGSPIEEMGLTTTEESRTLRPARTPAKGSSGAHARAVTTRSGSVSRDEEEEVDRDRVGDELVSFRTPGEPARHQSPRARKRGRMYKRRRGGNTTTDA